MAFHKLSPAQFNTGWVLCQLGRAYYEMVDYPAAANVFEFARQADRHRLEVELVSHHAPTCFVCIAVLALHTCLESSFRSQNVCFKIQKRHPF